MSDIIGFYVPESDEFRRGCEEYDSKEKRGEVWFESSEHIKENWGNHHEMARGVSWIIRSWNHYYSNFDFEELVQCIAKNIEVLEEFRNRDILSFSESDTEKILILFDRFLEALKRTRDGAKSPVSVAKALSVLCPYFLPLWDSYIVEHYDCWYFSDSAAPRYTKFCKKMKLLAEKVISFPTQPDDRPLLKRIDEYNYSKYTKGWI